MKSSLETRGHWIRTVAWILLVLASLVLIGYGIWHADWHIWLPSPAEQERGWAGSLYVPAYGRADCRRRSRRRG